MNRAVPFSVLLQRHPREVARMLANLKKSRSRDPDFDPANFQWSYDWGMDVSPGSSSLSLGESLWVGILARKNRKTARSGRLVPTPPELLQELEDPGDGNS